VGRSRVVSDEEETLKLLASEELSPDEEVILFVSPREANGTGSNRASEASKATIRSLKPERISIDVSTDGEGFLVLTDQYYPGWEARVDGIPTRIYRANYLFRCVAVPAGQHEVVFIYRPRSFRLGTMISCFGFSVLVGWAIWFRVRRSMKRKAKNGDLP
jgi:hypothetical protein